MKRLRCVTCRRRFWADRYLSNINRAGKCSGCLLDSLDRLLDALQDCDDDYVKELLRERYFQIIYAM